MDKFSAAVVAGGLNSRMGGTNKAFLKVGNKTILSRLITTLERYFDEILIVTKNPAEYSDYLSATGDKIKTVTDIYEDRSSLTGIHSALYHAKNFRSFIVPCDAPFIQPSLIELILGSIDSNPESDVVIPNYDGHYEPLCALYSKHCLPKIETLLNSKDYRIYNFFNAVNLTTIDKDRLQKADPKMLSFFNVNTKEALKAALIQSDQLLL
ncbi:MAG: molybdenum cofactor guanylyltransferase [Desulfamplus sp.]|nr:molybdenum cofactor guanylyltransferase [Desulfamplus sp.]MBF0388798.1 molybdenum cofactor guanylyltransferase [Desulfamplus sp.]